jgi:ketopantoate hydroxymethyltransferase
VITRDRIKKQYESRQLASLSVPLKINLFKGYETTALSNTVARLSTENALFTLDCIMLGDSLLTTHLGYETTVLRDTEAQSLFLRVFNDNLHEIRVTLDGLRRACFDPYLIADMPFGSAAHVDSALLNAETMSRYGADVLKIETINSEVINIVEELSASGYLVMGHVGYTPQAGGAKSRGTTMTDALEIFAQARRLRDAGAVALVLEGVSTLVNECLSKPDPNGLPVYSIFSGRTPLTGLSVNVWDCVIKPNFAARFFPPSAILSAEEVPLHYTPEVIEQCLENLLRSILRGEWPIDRAHSMSTNEIASLKEFQPWKPVAR